MFYYSYATRICQHNFYSLRNDEYLLPIYFYLMLCSFLLSAINSHLLTPHSFFFSFFRLRQKTAYHVTKDPKKAEIPLINSLKKQFNLRVLSQMINKQSITKTPYEQLHTLKKSIWFSLCGLFSFYN